MQKVAFYILLISFITACKSSKQPIEPKKENNINTEITSFKTYDGQNYPLYKGDKSFKEFLEAHYPSDKIATDNSYKYICIEGEISKNIYQHMMKGDPMGTEEHIYIDYGNKGGQVVGYYKTLNKKPQEGKKYFFFGELQSMSGAGKGGGTHTEYYIDLDAVE